MQLHLKDMLDEELVKPLVGQVDAELRERVALPPSIEILEAEDVEHAHTARDLAVGYGDGVVDLLDTPAEGERVDVHAQRVQSCRGLGGREVIQDLVVADDLDRLSQRREHLVAAHLSPDDIVGVGVSECCALRRSQSAGGHRCSAVPTRASSPYRCQPLCTCYVHARLVPVQMPAARATPPVLSGEHWPSSAGTCIASWPASWDQRMRSRAGRFAAAHLQQIDDQSELGFVSGRGAVGAVGHLLAVKGHVAQV